MRIWIACALAVTVLLSSVLRAEKDVLVLSVVDQNGKPLVGVSISTQGDGSSGQSDQNGKIRLVLPKDTPAGTSLGLVLTAPANLAILSPWNRRTVVPLYVPGTEVVEVVVCSQQCHDLIKNPKLVGALLARINADSSREPAPVGLAARGALMSAGGGGGGRGAVQGSAAARAARKKVATDVLARVSVPLDEFDAEVERIASGSDDPYLRGMAALYQFDLDSAVTFLSRASSAQGVSKDRAGNALFFTAQAYTEKGELNMAETALRNAYTFRPGDPLILNNWGSALIRDGKTAEGLDRLKQMSLILGKWGGGL